MSHFLRQMVDNRKKQGKYREICHFAIYLPFTPVVSSRGICGLVRQGSSPVFL